MSTSAKPKPLQVLDILVVENHTDTLKYLRLYLEQLGHVVRTAPTMRLALAELSGKVCDVLISDIGLPDGSGWELLETAQLPDSVYAIAMSGFGMGTDQTRSKAAGFRHHLLKPFTPEDLDGFLHEASRERTSAPGNS